MKIRNAHFAAEDPVFRKACELAQIPATRRQASKYRQKKGLAWDRRNEALNLVQQETP